ncbi:MAG: GatB/YqeY domain-containing protein [Cyclobacteriaceae bacterium]
MSLKQTIDSDIKKAMLAKDKDSLRALRAVKSQILLAETEKGSTEELTEETELKLLQKAVKQRNDSISIYKEQGREDLAEVEQLEVDVISKYLPAQLSAEALEIEIEAIIKQTGATGPQDMGKVMGVASKALAGKADGKAIADTVKSILNR